MAMDMEACFALLAKRRRDEIVITSAGNSSELWWETTRDRNNTFYLEASMSLSTMFTAGIALGYPGARFWAFMGDGAFVMNTGVLFVERWLALPNMVSVIMANRCYGSTSAAALPDGQQIDFAAVAKAAGIANVFHFSDLATLDKGFDTAFQSVGSTTIVLELAAPTRHFESPPIDGPEMKYLFGRALEERFGQKVLP